MGVLQKLAEKFAVQTAVYWGSPVNDGYGGRTFATPREILVRWDDDEHISKDSFGNDFKTKAKLIVTEDLDFEGFCMLGSLSEVTGKTPFDFPGRAYQIIRKTMTPMVRKTDDFLRIVYLSENI